MRIHRFTVAVGLCSLFLPSLCHAQSLAEAAAKEKARRKALTPGKTYTDDDLRRAGGPAAAPAATADTTATPAGDSSSAPKEGSAPASGAKTKTDDELRAEREKEWHDRLTKANDEVARLNADISSLEAALGDLSQNLYSTTRTSQLTQLEDDKSKLAAAQRSLADLQEEGRRSGYR
jgi:hypothetical protein